MNQKLIAKSEAYRMFRYEEIRSTGTYTDINSLVNQSVVDYEAGYTKAVTDLSTENAQLRGALTHLVNLCDANSYDEVILYQMEYNIDLDTVLNQAKQLLTDKE